MGTRPGEGIAPSITVRVDAERPEFSLDRAALFSVAQRYRETLNELRSAGRVPLSGAEIRASEQLLDRLLSLAGRETKQENTAQPPPSFFKISAAVPGRKLSQGEVEIINQRQALSEASPAELIAQQQVSKYEKVLLALALRNQELRTAVEGTQKRGEKAAPAVFNEIRPGSTDDQRNLVLRYNEFTERQISMALQIARGLASQGCFGEAAALDNVIQRATSSNLDEWKKIIPKPLHRELWGATASALEAGSYVLDPLGIPSVLADGAQQMSEHGRYAGPSMHAAAAVLVGTVLGGAGKAERKGVATFLSHLGVTDEIIKSRGPLFEKALNCVFTGNAKLAQETLKQLEKSGFKSVVLEGVSHGIIGDTKGLQKIIRLEAAGGAEHLQDLRAMYAAVSPNGLKGTSDPVLSVFESIKPDPKLVQMYKDLFESTRRIPAGPTPDFVPPIARSPVGATGQRYDALDGTAAGSFWSGRGRTERVSVEIVQKRKSSPAAPETVASGGQTLQEALSNVVAELGFKKR